MQEKIQNARDLATTESRKKALQIAEAGLQAIDSALVTRNQVRLERDKFFIKEKEYSLKEVERLFVVGIGKCALAAAGALEEILGERIADGVVVDQREGKLQHMRAFQGDHPLPTERNTRATKAIIELLNTATEKDLVLFLVSGGGSTLLCQSESLTCEQEAVVLQCLFNAGAAIQDINTLRKHLSLARGGYLAKYAYPAQVLSLVFSDVPGNDLSFVASGPTVKDETAKADAERILEHYQVRELRGFSAIELLETPKEERYFKNVENILFLSNDTALHAMEEKAKELGLKAVIQTTTLVGEAKQVGESIAKALHQQSSCALLYGGETTVAVENSGKGGRSLELCLSALRFLEHGELIFAFASDGLDNTEAAGVLCDILTKEKVREKGLDLMEYLEGNRSFEFFEKTGDLVFTGLTGSNVSDLIIAIKE